MSHRTYDYFGDCVKCGHEIEREIKERRDTSAPPRTRWVRCAECRTITTVHKMTATDAMSGGSA